MPKTLTVEERTANMTRQDCYVERDKWLDRGVKLEDDGKSDNMVNLAVNKAGEYEAHGAAKPA